MRALAPHDHLTDAPHRTGHLARIPARDMTAPLEHDVWRTPDPPRDLHRDHLGIARYTGDLDLRERMGWRLRVLPVGPTTRSEHQRGHEPCAKIIEPVSHVRSRARSLLTPASPAT